MNAPKVRANYNWRLAAVGGHAMILIVDLDMGNMSVTNDVEAVVAEIKELSLLPITQYRVMYRDSDGVWDEILLDAQGNYANIASGAQYAELAQQAWLRGLD